MIVANFRITATRAMETLGLRLTRLNHSRKRASLRNTFRVTWASNQRAMPLPACDLGDSFTAIPAPRRKPQIVSLTASPRLSSNQSHFRRIKISGYSVAGNELEGCSGSSHIVGRSDSPYLDLQLASMR